MVREPLYQRIERFIRDRWGSIGLVLALGVPVFVLLVVESIILRSWLSAGFAAYFGVLLIIAASIRVVVPRKRGRRLRKAAVHVVGSPSGWPALDTARLFYSARTGLDAPVIAVGSQDIDGRRNARVDAELVYIATTGPESGARPCRGPLDARPGDAMAVSFSEPMLDSYSAEELLAVMLHLTERAALWTQATFRVSNGACEADSRTLLITHDHAALLRALEKCDLAQSTFAPGYGRVLFSDLDLTARKRAGEREAEWDARNRLTELREHLMAAGLDVPRRSR